MRSPSEERDRLRHQGRKLGSQTAWEQTQAWLLFISCVTLDKSLDLSVCLGSLSYKGEEIVTLYGCVLWW